MSFGPCGLQIHKTLVNHSGSHIFAKAIGHPGSDHVVMLMQRFFQYHLKIHRIWKFCLDWIDCSGQALTIHNRNEVHNQKISAHPPGHYYFSLCLHKQVVLMFFFLLSCMQDIFSFTKKKKIIKILSDLIGWTSFQSEWTSATLALSLATIVNDSLVHIITKNK